MSHILTTGANGFAARALVRKLLGETEHKREVQLTVCSAMVHRGTSQSRSNRSGKPTRTATS